MKKEPLWGVARTDVRHRGIILPQGRAFFNDGWTEKKNSEFYGSCKKSGIMWNDTASVTVYFSARSPGGRGLSEENSSGCVKYKINRDIVCFVWPRVCFVCLFVFCVFFFLSPGGQNPEVNMPQKNKKPKHKK